MQKNVYTLPVYIHCSVAVYTLYSHLTPCYYSTPYPQSPKYSIKPIINTFMQAQGNKVYNITWKRSITMKLAFLLWEKGHVVNISQSPHSSKSNNHRVMMKYSLLLASTATSNCKHMSSLYLTLLNSRMKVCRILISLHLGWDFSAFWMFWTLQKNVYFRTSEMTASILFSTEFTDSDKLFSGDCCHSD